MEIGLVHTGFGNNLRNGKIGDHLVEFGDLFRNVSRLILSVLEIHRAHNDGKLFGGLGVNQEFAVGSFVDFTSDLVLDDLNIGGTEIRLIERSCHHIAANGVFGIGDTDISSVTKTGYSTERLLTGGSMIAGTEVHTTVLHPLSWPAKFYEERLTLRFGLLIIGRVVP